MEGDANVGNGVPVHPSVHNSRQSSLLSFYKHERKEKSHTTDRSQAYHARSNPGRSELTGERAVRAQVSKETIEHLPHVLSQLPSKAPVGYLYTEKKPPKLILDPRYCPKLKGEVRIVEGDTFDTAIQFDQLFPRGDSKNARPICVLNMASARSAGGGWRNGALAQEEDLCYRSSLFFTLKIRFYPLGELEGIYSPNVVIIRKNTKESYAWLDTANATSLPVVSAVSMAAIKNPERVPGEKHLMYKKSSDRELMKEKMRVILRIAAYNRHRKLVLGAFGCGAFNNPREEVANCWAEVLQEGEFKGWWETIVFAILIPPVPSKNERTSLEIFREVLDGLSV